MFGDSRLQIHVTLNEIWLYESDPNAQMLPVHEANLEWGAVSYSSLSITQVEI